jgi:hypothetical protein
MYALTSDLVPAPCKIFTRKGASEYLLPRVLYTFHDSGFGFQVVGLGFRLLPSATYFPGSDRLSNDFLVRNRYHGRVGD